MGDGGHVCDAAKLEPVTSESAKGGLGTGTGGLGAGTTGGAELDVDGGDAQFLAASSHLQKQIIK